MALVQVLAGGMLVTSMRGGPWDLEYALLSAPFVGMGLVILAFAARNCSRLWRVEAWEASWGVVAALAVTMIFSFLIATGPLTVGEWRWTSLPYGAFGGFLVVVLTREVRRRLVRKTDTPNAEHAESH